jgi:hypothetical protein
MAESAKSHEKLPPLRRPLARRSIRTVKRLFAIKAREPIMQPVSYNVGDAFMGQDLGGFV